MSRNQFIKLHPCSLSSAVRAHSHSQPTEAKPAAAGWTAGKDHPMNARVYDQITERIIALLAKGTVPWHKPWKARTGLPRNLVSKKSYRGINVFLLLAMSYESPFWLTFRQALQLGGTVRKGEKSCPVVFWKQATVEDKETREPQKIPLLRYYHVFNVAQCDGLKRDTEPVETFVNTFIKPDEIIAHMPQRPVIKYGMARAFYSPREDYVGLPVKERFERAESFYATLFHEIVHSTGHESRLNRATLTDKAGFGSNPYCKEELIAEMGQRFCAARPRSPSGQLIIPPRISMAGWSSCAMTKR